MKMKGKVGEIATFASFGWGTCGSELQFPCLIFYFFLISGSASLTQLIHHKQENWLSFSFFRFMCLV